MRISILLFKPRLRIPFYGLPTIEWNFYIQGMKQKFLYSKTFVFLCEKLLFTEIQNVIHYLSLVVIVRANLSGNLMMVDRSL